MKKDILDAVIERLKKDTKAYQSSLDTLDTGINLDENALIEPDDISQKDQATDIADDLQVQPEILNNTINTVKSYQAMVRNVFSPGALVETDGMYLLAGVSLPPLHINNKKVIGVPEDAKIYPSLQGKKKGDQIQLANQVFTILSVS